MIISDKETRLDKFLEYCKARRYSIIAAFFIVMVVYGVWMFNYFVTFDAEGFYSFANGEKWYSQWIGLGRWGFVFLKKLLNVIAINPFFSISVFLVCFPLSAILWDYVFWEWGIKNTASLLLFSLIYLTHPIYALQFGYRNQMEVISIVMCILPFSVLYETIWLREKKAINFILAIVGVIFCFAGYQSFIVIYIEANAIYFMCQIVSEWKKNQMQDSREFLRQMIKAGIFSAMAYLLYRSISKVIIYILGVPSYYYKSYTDSNIMWNQLSIGECINNIIIFLRDSFIGNSTVYTAAYFWATLLLFFMIIYIWVRKKPWKIRFTFISVAVVFIPFLLEFIMAGIVVSRSQLDFVYTLGFLVVFEYSLIVEKVNWNEKRALKQLLTIVTIGYLVVPQIQMNTRLLYSDYRVSANDYSMMQNIYNSALQKGAKEGDALYVIGTNANAVDETMVESEVIGFSYFEVISIADTKVVEAMQAYGFKVSLPTEEQKEYALSIADEMPSWPDSESIRVEGGLIIVKLS